MTMWIVTRHPGAVEWLARQGLTEGRLVPHLDLDTVQAGDSVVGTLPVNLAAEVCAKGARMMMLSLRLPPELRGIELTAEQLDQCGAVIEEYWVERVG